MIRARRRRGDLLGLVSSAGRGGSASWRPGARGLVLAGIAVAVLTAGCNSPSRRTADAIGCKVTEVDIVDSVYKRQGVTTTWCAQCRDKRYRCVSNADRSRIECRPAEPGDGCL